MPSRNLVAVVTDSTACLPRGLVLQYRISVIPMTFSFGEVTYKDDPDTPPGEFYRLLEEGHEFPTTSLASPGAYLEVFSRLAQERNGILCVTLASNLSGLYNSALVAASVAKESYHDLEIQVVDSQTATMAQGFMVLEAARAAERGEDLEGVKRAAEALVPKVGVVAVMDTLKYLGRSGRVPKLGVIAGTIINAKPMLGIAHGEVNLGGVARSKARAVERLVEMVREARPAGAVLHAAIMHADVPSEAERVREMIGRTFNCRELYISQFTPVMGMYTGPGVLAIAYYYE